MQKTVITGQNAHPPDGVLTRCETGKQIVVPISGYYIAAAIAVNNFLGHLEFGYSIAPFEILGPETGSEIASLTLNMNQKHACLKTD